MFKRKLRTVGKFLFAAFMLEVGLSSAFSDTVGETRDIYKEYISVRKMIGEEKSNWESQKVTLADMIAVLKTEISQTKETIASLEDSASTADLRRAELKEQLEVARAASASFGVGISEYERKITQTITLLPDMLKTEIAPLKARLPENPENSRLSYSQRIQTVVGLLAQIDKFNSDLRTTTEVKSFDGSSQEVQTLYFGLAGALFSNNPGTYAGYGKPEGSGWKWITVDGKEAESIRAALDIYSARAAPAFVSVPLAID